MNTLWATAAPRRQDTRPGPGLAGLGGTWCDDGQCWRGLAWGDESWFEPALGRTLQQELDLFPVDREQRASPLILYLHPPRDTRTIYPVRSPLYPRLVQAARACGFALASIEYRDAQRLDIGEPAPDNDVAQARRWIHAHAHQLGIDSQNVFLVDLSQARLGLWTVTRQQRDPALRINAAYSHRPNASWQGAELARRFVVDGHWLAFDDRVAPENAFDGVVPFFQRHLR